MRHRRTSDIACSISSGANHTCLPTRHCARRARLRSISCAAHPTCHPERSAARNAQPRRTLARSRRIHYPLSQRRGPQTRSRRGSRSFVGAKSGRRIHFGRRLLRMTIAWGRPGSDGSEAVTAVRRTTAAGRQSAVGGLAVMVQSRYGAASNDGRGMTIGVGGRAVMLEHRPGGVILKEAPHGASTGARSGAD